MADYQGTDWQSTTMSLRLSGIWAVEGVSFIGEIWRIAMPVFKMRGMDAAVSGTYDTWLSSGQPDLTGAGYRGSLATPLRDIVVVDYW